MKFKLFTLLSFLFCSVISSQELKIEEIESKFDKCVEKNENYTTAGMINCINTAKYEWDKSLNKYYKLLTEILKSNESKEKLKISQRNWIKYRDSEFEMINELETSEVQGTMWLVICADHKMDIVEKRALELKNYYETIMQSR